MLPKIERSKRKVRSKTPVKEESKEEVKVPMRVI